MKKLIRICLIVSFVLLLIGGSLVVYALSRASFDWNKLTVNVENETFDYTVPGTVRDVKINVKQADVHVVPSSNSSCIVRAKVSSRGCCTAETVDGVLSVICSDDSSRPWYKRIWMQDDMTVTVFLPDDAYENLNIDSGSGDVYVSDELTFRSGRVKTGSGDQEIFAPISDDLSVSSSSGDIAVKRMGCKSISVKSESGEIDVDNCRSDAVSVVTSSGELSLSNCTVKNMQTNTASGDMAFSQITVSQQLVVTSSSGDILFMHSSANDLQITAKSGNVTGTLTEPMQFDVRSDSGDIVLPPSGGTNRCAVRTGSGDVTFVMQESDEG